MQVLKKLVLTLLALLVIFLLVGFFLPSHFEVRRSTLINAPTEKVFAQIDTPRQWPSWTIWNQRDPKMEISYSGPERGLNAGWSWKSATEGNGNMVFTAVEPNKQLTYKLSFPDMGMESTGMLLVEAEGAATKLTWTNEGEMGANPINRYFGLFMDQLVGPDFESGLANLKNRIETSAS